MKALTEIEVKRLQLVKEIGELVNWKRLEDEFDMRFTEWWELFKPFIRKQLKPSPIVKKSRFNLDRWVMASRNGFRGTLHGLFIAQMDSWPYFWASMPFELDIYDEQFNVGEYIEGAKSRIEDENLKTTLDNVFHLPEHAAASALIVKQLEEDLIREKQPVSLKDLEALVDSYLDTCDKFQTSKPSLEQLKECSGRNKTVWHRRLHDATFLAALAVAARRKMNLAKTSKDFWVKVYLEVKTIGLAQGRNMERRRHDTQEPREEIASEDENIERILNDDTERFPRRKF